MTRRSFFAMSIAMFPMLRCAAAVPAALAARTVPERFVRLRTRPPAVPAEQAAAAGLLKLDLSADRDGAFYVPAGRAPASGFPLILLLHGAGGSGSRAITRFVAQADRVGAILLAPDSRGSTWDVIRGGGGDAPFIDLALQKIFKSYPIDPRLVTVAGFSDGASYALTLGVTNGDLLSAIAAFSPGFLVVGTEIKGKPSVFISHGTKDEILPIDRCGREVAAALRHGGYSVDYREFDGKHSLPPIEILTAAFDLLGRGAAKPR